MAMTVFLTLIVISILMAVWVVWVRPALRDKPSMQGFFAVIEPIEILLWSKSETILWARFKQAVGIVLTGLMQLGAVDLSPLLPFVPEEYRPLAVVAINMLPMIAWLDGTIGVMLRKDVSEPVEVVALPQAIPVSVAAAIEQAEQAKATAVAAAEGAPALTAAGEPLTKIVKAG